MLNNFKDAARWRLRDYIYNSKWVKYETNRTITYRQTHENGITLIIYVEKDFDKGEMICTFKMALAPGVIKYNFEVEYLDINQIECVEPKTYLLSLLSDKRNKPNRYIREEKENPPRAKITPDEEEEELNEEDKCKFE